MSARAAVAYASQQRWAVFQVAADCRTPIKGPGFEHGVHDATSDPGELERRWRMFPTANVALACGARSGVFALDLDVKTADGRSTLAEIEDEQGRLPETPTSRTPSGGMHILFRQPVGRKLRNRVGFRPGLDIRAAGGSICLPPSRRSDGAYEWIFTPGSLPIADAPDWLLEMIDPPEPPRAPRPALRIQSSDRAARYVERAVDGEHHGVANTAPGAGRNQRLFQASANLGGLVGAGLLPQDLAERTLEDAAHACGLVRDDGLHAVRASIRSGMRRGIAKPREVCFERR